MIEGARAGVSGKFKCVFIDPPYNTGNAFEHYDDAIEHSLWLSLIRCRLEILRRLLSEDGSIWKTIDDTECHHFAMSFLAGSILFLHSKWEKDQGRRGDTDIYTRQIKTPGSFLSVA